MRAYDLEILKRPADRSSADNHGWCFGLPPGIAPEQWLAAIEASRQSPVDRVTPRMRANAILFEVD